MKKELKGLICGTTEAIIYLVIAWHYFGPHLYELQMLGVNIDATPIAIEVVFLIFAGMALGYVMGIKLVTLLWLILTIEMVLPFYIDLSILNIPGY